MLRSPNCHCGIRRCNETTSWPHKDKPDTRRAAGARGEGAQVPVYAGYGVRGTVDLRHCMPTPHCLGLIEIIESCRVRGVLLTRTVG